MESQEKEIAAASAAIEAKTQRVGELAVSIVQNQNAAKDATELVDSSTARVSLMALQGALIQDVEMGVVLTPNGDGINDELQVSFALLKVLEERPLGVDFYDLSGRLMGKAAGGGEMGKVGSQTFIWDGRDLSGQVVPPGVYLCRIKVEADDQDSQLMRLVHVAY